MARKRTLNVGILNITTHPHSPENYLALLNDVIERRYVAKTRGYDRVMLGKISSIYEGDPLRGVKGVLKRFVEIDENKPWINVNTGSPVLNGNGEPVKPVDGRLQPNYDAVNFVFFPRKHLMYFDAGRLSPRLAAKGMAGLFSHAEIIEKYNFTDVKCVVADDEIERVMGVQVLNSVNIDFILPNPDDISSEKRRIVERMQRKRAKKLGVVYDSESSEGLNRDSELAALVSIAQDNGRVRAVGHEDGRKVKFDTDDHPEILQERYDPSLMQANDVLLGAAERHYGVRNRER